MPQEPIAPPRLSLTAESQIEHYASLLESHNQQVNLVSRKLTSQELRRSIRHCLFIANRGFPSGSGVLDIGTGGGLPGIPLAIALPEVEFFLVDSIAKKCQATSEIVKALGLVNTQTINSRVEDLKSKLKVSYCVSRATTDLSRLWTYTLGVLDPKESASTMWSPGLLCLKGGDLSDEIAQIRRIHPNTAIEQYPLSPAAQYPDKYLISVQHR